jgi:RNA recognition motif-containing protein
MVNSIGNKLGIINGSNKPIGAHRPVLNNGNGFDNPNSQNINNMTGLVSGLASININEHNERTVCLSDLDLNTNEKHLEDFFNAIKISYMKIVKQPFCSFAHVTFFDSSIARLFLEKNIFAINNKIIRVMPYNYPNSFDPSANLIIKNLENFLTEADIIEKFKDYGEILSCKLARDQQTGESKCYAYLQFKNKLSASKAIDTLNNTYWDEKFDPDVQYQKFKSRLLVLQQSQHMLGQLNDDLLSNELFSDFDSRVTHGKKIYVGLFRKKEEYSKIKSSKEGKQTNLYVKNFGPDFGDRDLFNLFKAYGSIKSAKVRRLKCGIVEKPLGCGFVDFEFPEEAENARNELDGFVIPESNRKISVTYADCKSRRLRKKLEMESEKYNSASPSPSIIQSIDENVDDTNTEYSFDSNSEFDKPIENHQNARLAQVSNKVLKIAQINDSENDDRTRSESTSSIASFDISLYDWSDIWNKKLQTSNWNEYNLFDNKYSSPF